MTAIWPTFLTMNLEFIGFGMFLSFWVWNGSLAVITKHQSCFVSTGFKSY